MIDLNTLRDPAEIFDAIEARAELVRIAATAHSERAQANFEASSSKLSASAEEIGHLRRLEAEVSEMLLELDASYMEDLIGSQGDQ